MARKGKVADPYLVAQVRALIDEVATMWGIPRQGDWRAEMDTIAEEAALELALEDAALAAWDRVMAEEGRRAVA